MLVRLTNEDIRKYWDLIRDTLDASLATRFKKSEGLYTKVLEMLLDGTMQAWMAGTSEMIYGFCLTTIEEHFELGHKSLLIYAIHRFAEPTAQDMWAQGLETLQRFARSVGCKLITAYTTDSRIVNLARQLKADTKTTLISWEV